MTRGLIAASVALLVMIVLAFGSLFTVQQTEQALLTQFGRPVRVIETAGLHTKLPFIQTVIPFDRRLLYLGTPSEEVIPGDQRRLIVDSFTMFRITDPLKFYQAVGTGKQGVQLRLDAIVSSAIRRALGTRPLPDVLSADQDRIMASIRDQVNSEMASFGVFVEECGSAAPISRGRIRRRFCRACSRNGTVWQPRRALRAPRRPQNPRRRGRDRTGDPGECQRPGGGAAGHAAPPPVCIAFRQKAERLGVWRRLERIAPRSTMDDQARVDAG